jgi:hypothetical protein
VRTRLFFVCIALILVASWGRQAAAFEIQYPGEDGFFIGKPMVYMITGDSNDRNVGQEGIFTFGPDRITIDGEEYYDCIFDSPSGSSHFYLELDPVRGRLIQKGFKIGSSELTVDPAVTALDYPLSSGDSWSESTDLTAKDVEIPGLGPLSFSIKGVKAKAEVSSKVISVPAGTFDTLLVEATFSGSWLGIPMTLIQRTWLSEDNITVKRNFEFVKPTGLLLYEIELSSLTPTPWDLNWDGSVDILDVVIVAKRFGERVTKPMIPNPDVDGSGIVDILDLAEVGIHFGESYSWAAPPKRVRTKTQ